MTSQGEAVVHFESATYVPQVGLELLNEVLFELLPRLVEEL